MLKELKKLRRVAFFSLAALFAGCSTDLDPNDDYRETMIIYSMLDPGETTHYAKVTKAFWNTNSNALTIAANHPDSMYYPNSELEVKLLELTPDSVARNTYPMEAFMATGKEPGIFSTEKQIMYRTTQPVNLNERSVYRVHVKNTRTGAEAYGSTPIVLNTSGPESNSQPFCVRQVSNALVPYGQCFDTLNVADFSPQVKGNAVNFRPSFNASIYTIKQTFKYSETTGGVTQNKEVSWYVKNNFIFQSNPSSANNNFSEPIPENFFFDELLKRIDTSQDQPDTRRTAGNVYFTLTGGSDVLRRNYGVNNSYSILLQTKPEYDNIVNGTGLVASRRKKVVKAVFTPASSADLKLNSRYASLKFK